MKLKLLLSLAAFSAAAVSASAITVFSDNFDTENGGTGITNYSSFANWTVSGGSVDLIGNGYFDFQPGNGLYVDMDGTTSNAGKLTSVLLNLTKGNYVLSYLLAGNHRNGSAEKVDVLVEVGIASDSHSLAEDDDFQLFTLDFSLAADQAVQISFEGLGGDNIGMLLDDVKLEKLAVPDSSSTVALLGVAVAALGFARRKLR